MTSPRQAMLYLSHAHYDQLRASGLTNETIALAGLETQPNQKTIYKLLNWASQPGPRSHKFGDCLVIPCFEPGSDEIYAHRVRPDGPRPDKKKADKFVKYESPAKCGIIVYYPPRTRAENRLRTAKTIVFCEGEKKALLLDQLGYAVVGLTGVNNFHDPKVRNPDGQPKGSGPLVFHERIAKHLSVHGCEVIVAYDSDLRVKPAVENAAMDLADTAYAAGAKGVRLALPPDEAGYEKMGIDDFFAFVEKSGGSGAEAIAKLFADAPLIDLSKRDRRPRIVLGTDEHRATDEAEIAISRAPELYVRSGRIVRIVHATRVEQCVGVKQAIGTPSVGVLPLASLREAITREGRVVKLDGEGAELPAHPTDWLVKSLAARDKHERMRELVGVTDSPILRPDGTVLARSGYDAESMMFVELDAALEGMTVPESPSQEDAKAAADQLLDLVADFPFASNADRAAWLACLLSGFARSAYSGPTPLFLINAAVKGTGKSLLAKLTAIVVTGRQAGEAGYAHDPTEMAKRITSIALKGNRVVLLDNVDGQFGNDALNRALTSTLWSERLLGGNEHPDLVLRTIWMATANNPDVHDELTRRLLPIRLLSTDERPEQRSGFKHENIAEYALANRARFACAALTMLRAFIAAKRPLSGVGRLGAFEGWRDLVAGAVRYGYGTDPLDSRELGEVVVDERLVALRALLEALIEGDAVNEMGGVRAREILHRMGLLDGSETVLSTAWGDARDLVDALVKRRKGEPLTVQQFGKGLQCHVSRAVETKYGLRKLVHQRDRNAQKWWVEPVTAHPGAPVQPDPAASQCRNRRNVSSQSGFGESSTVDQGGNSRGVGIDPDIASLRRRDPGGDNPPSGDVDVEFEVARSTTHSKAAE